MLASKVGVNVDLENNDLDTPADLLQLCTRHNQASKDESGTTQVHIQRMVEEERRREEGMYFESCAERGGKNTAFGGTDRFDRTPAEMRREANKHKMTDGSNIAGKKPDPPKGPRPEKRPDGLGFEYNR